MKPEDWNELAVKNRISNWQAILLVLLTILSTTILFVPSASAMVVNQDAWLTVIMATMLAALLIFYPLADLGIRYPGKTIVQYSEDILGKIPGKAVGLLLFFNFFLFHCYTLREFGELAVLFLPQTPILVNIIMLSSLSAYGVYLGLKVISRGAEIFFFLGLFSFLFLVLLNVGNVDLSNLKPVMESGYKPLLRATLYPLEWLAIGSVFGIVTSFVANGNELKKIGLTTIGTAGLLLTVLSIIITTVISPALLKVSAFPLLTLARFSNIPVLQRIEVFIIIFWVTWIFVRTSVFSFATVLSLKKGGHG